jgi:hypothetical protein
MKTINERIVSATREVDRLCQSLGLVYPNDLESILARHFAEPWLDAPDGPGWWWIEGFGVLTTTNVRQDEYDAGYWVQGYKWQRAIGPSE